MTTRDGGALLVGADIQFRIWNPVMSVVSVQDLNASTRMTAQNALTHSLAKKTVHEVQTERVKLGEYLQVRPTVEQLWLFTDLAQTYIIGCCLQMDINEMTHPWGLEVDRVELALGSVLRAPEEGTSGPLIMPSSVPGLEGIAGPIQQLAMHFLNHSGGLQPQQGLTALS